MNRRSFLWSVALAPIAAALAACGDPNQQPTATEPTNPGTAPATVPAGIAHPTGADEVVLKVAYEGGFVPLGYGFTSIPALLVSGDGRVFTQGVIAEIYPGPLLPTVLMRTITEVGLQALLGVARDGGLMAAPPDYSGGDNVADASNTVVTINASGGNFVHSAYALGIDNPEAPARRTLLDTVTRLTDLEATAGTANLGLDQPFVASDYRLQATAIESGTLAGQEPAPTIVDWPAAAGVSLSAASGCARVDAAAVGSLFIDATQNTYFKDGEVVYQLAVRGVLPGDPAC